MKTTAVSDLKASLSKYLRQVKAGEEVLITERGKAVAKIIPVSPRERLPEYLAAMEEEGLLKIGKGRLPKSFWEATLPVDSDNLALQALLEEREAGR